MNVTYIILLIISLDFAFNTWLNYRNNKAAKQKIPDLLKGLYDEEEYRKSNAYQEDKYNIQKITSLLSFIVTFVFISLGGIAFLDRIIAQLELHGILSSLLYFGALGLASYVINLPFSYYKIFRIESKYGFNTMSRGLFWMDQIKGSLLFILVGGGLLSGIIWIYFNLTEEFWWVAWICISLFSLIMTFTYSSFIVPLFNKQSPLEKGPLLDSIHLLAGKLGFELNQIYVIDGSKRSTKANAYFTGFGAKKRIVLFDTLIQDLGEDEILAVLAHEIGHYKKKHVIINLINSILLTGFTLWVLNFVLQSSELMESLGVESPNFHVGLLVFVFIYQPISEFTGIIMNFISRQFEYQADDYAKTHTKAEDLIEALKKLNRKSLSNVTPDKYYEFVHYSHPNIERRIKALMS